MLRRQFARVRLQLHRDEPAIVVISVPNGRGLFPVTTVRIQGERKVLMPAIGIRIRRDGRAEQSEPQHITLAVIPVFQIIDQRESFFSVTEVGPAQGWDFELRLPAAVIARGWSLDLP